MSLFIATAAAEPAILVTLTEQVRSFLDGVLTLDPEQAAISAGLSLLVLIGAALVMLCLRLLLRALIERFAPADPDAATKRPRIGRWTMPVARLAVFVAAFLVILRVWGVDLAELTNGPFGVVLGVAGRLALIVVLSLAAIEISQLAIRQLFSRVADRAGACAAPRKSAHWRRC
jgi:hypothetical protein